MRWRLQQLVSLVRLPEPWHRRLRNVAVAPGPRAAFADNRPSPELVIYGLIDHHEVRNVAPAGWMSALTTASRAGALMVLFVTVNPDATIERHPPEGIPRLASEDPACERRSGRRPLF